MATKPPSHLDWGVGNPDPVNRIVEPSGAKKTAAWLDNERPPAPFFNWLFNRIDAWLKYFEEVSDAFSAEYDVIVGDTGSDPAATHDTLADAIADGSLANDVKVLIKTNYTIDTTIVLSKPGWRITFNPGVTYTRGTAATGIQVNAANVEIESGRFANFTTGGDKAIELLAPAIYCILTKQRFAVGTDTEIDESAVPAGQKPAVSLQIAEI